MLKKFARTFVVLFVAGSACAQDQFQPVRDAIEKLVTTEHVPSITVGVAKDGKIVWEQGFGLANRFRHIPANADTMYSIASISKPMTGTALMTLVQAGKVNLDRPINDYLGSEPIQARIGDTNGATVRRVANHSSGLPEHYQLFYENEPWNPPSPSESIRRFGWLMSVPGEKYEYSNLGYGILSELIARTSGQSFADYMRHAVFEPLGMTHTRVGNDPALHDFEAVRYGIDGNPVPLFRTDHPGASEVYSSCHDLLLFGMFQMKEHLPQQSRILTDQSIDAMQEPTMSEGDGKGYGVGLETARVGGLLMHAHTGGMTGVQTELRIIPSERLVVVVLINSEIYDLPGKISDEIMEAALPNWKAPRPASDSDAAGSFTAPKGMIGHWTGKVALYDRELRVKVDIRPDNEVHVKLDGNLEALLNRPVLTKDGYLRGIFSGSIPLQDDVRRPYLLGLNLKLRDATTLSGEILFQADRRGVPPTYGLYPSVGGQPAPEQIQTDAFKFAQWFEVTKQN